ncbi:tetratricopeptide repeat protein [candidate division KSB1 bacterium]|nr:tetratricopeptide repeat protein [candidate division KSB1 bacterium]
MKNCFLNPLLFVIALPLAIDAQPRTADLRIAVEWSIDQDYASALQQLERLQAEYPEHPAPPFFKAAVYQSMMLDFESKRWQNEFYDYIDRSIDLAQSYTANADEEIPPVFYQGAALSYKSYQLGRDKKYFSAIKLGLTAIGLLKQSVAQNPNFSDPLVGIGSFLYWRSHLTRLFKWLPFVPDEREKGIELIRQAGECSRLTRWAALSNLAWIYIEEKRYPLAVQAAEQGLAFFPESRFFLWPSAEAHFRAGDYSDALLYFSRLLRSIQGESINNRYNEIVVYWKIARCCEELGYQSRAVAACEQLLALEPDAEVVDRARDKFKNAEKLLQKLHRSNALQ